MSALAAFGRFAALAAVAGCAMDGEADSPPPDYTSSYFRIDRIDLPQDAADAADAALDLDRDGSPDNMGGNALASLQATIETAGEELPRSVAAGLDGGRVHWIIEIGRDSVVPGRTAAALHAADDSDGDLVYEIADGIALTGDGRDNDGAVRTWGGAGRVPASFLADVQGDWPVTWVNGIAVGLAVSQPSDEELAGRLGFATRGDFAPVIAGPLAAFMTERLQAGTLVYAADMDTDGDGVITPEELLASPLTRALLAPDLDLLEDDEVADSLSACFHIHATAVSLE
ncbi:MAG TPA: hypothetical protein VFU21_15905 [Kofleriaceae bacterium]|nr:hypothetical protein [Kofleriaceae bacterium]